MYILGLGSPTHPLPGKSYLSWTSTYRWKKLYGHEFLYGAPLFMHQLSHLWVDFRRIQDAFMREHGSDYFDNSRKATEIHREYARRNPLDFEGYGEHCWGITATDGPGFDRDEDPQHLGERLILPPWLEPHRNEIEAALPPLTLPSFRAA